MATDQIMHLLESLKEESKEIREKFHSLDKKQDLAIAKMVNFEKTIEEHMKDDRQSFDKIMGVMTSTNGKMEAMCDKHHKLSAHFLWLVGCLSAIAAIAGYLASFLLKAM